MLFINKTVLFSVSTRNNLSQAKTQIMLSCLLKDVKDTDYEVLYKSRILF